MPSFASNRCTRSTGRPLILVSLLTIVVLSLAPHVRATPPQRPGPANSADAMLVQPNGKMLVAGTTKYCGDSCIFQNDPPYFSGAVIRLNPDGLLDGTFGDRGVARLSFPRDVDHVVAVERQPKGRIVVIARAHYVDGPNEAIVARLTAAGELDRDFGRGGYVIVAKPAATQLATAATTSADGAIWIASDSTVSRLTPNGRLDNGFGTNGVATITVPGTEASYVQSLVVRPSGALVAGGVAFDRAGPARSGGLFAAQLTSGGSPDPGFADGGVRRVGGITSEFILDLAAPALLLEHDGDVVLAGHQAANSPVGHGVACPRTLLARLKPDGSPDPQFGIGGVSEGPSTGGCGVNDAALDQRGRILVVRGTRRINIERHTTTGALQRQFGDDGIASLRLGQAKAHPVAVSATGQGRIVGAADAFPYEQCRHVEPRGATCSAFTVAELKRTGKTDKGFGERGFATWPHVSSD